MLSTEKFLSNVDEDLFKVMLRSAIPSPTISGITIPDVIYWKFCDVMDLTEKNIFDAVDTAIGIFGPEEKIDILKTNAVEFLSFAKHIQNEFEKVSLLFEQIKKDPDANLEAAGINQMNKFGILSIYYGISKNPLDWDAISEVAFHKMYSKLMMDKISGDIQDNYSKIMTEKSKR